jgi:parallel beta-helix repeat protein
VSAAGPIAATMIAAPPLGAGEILVPGNFATIGEAIAAATAGDTILVGPGVYAESIVFSEGAGDGIVLQSTNGPLETTIAYGEVASVNEAVVAFQRCSSATRLAGFTIDGRGVAKRGVLANSESRPALADLVIEGADHGVASHRGSCPVLQDVRIRKCATAGLFVQDGSADATSSSFADGEKFGVYIRGTTEPVRLRACSVAGNAQVGVQAIEGELVFAGGEVVDNGNTGFLLRAVSPEISDATVARNANVGIVMESSSAVIRRCTVSENGFGAVVSIAGEPKIFGCTFENNRTYHVGIEGDANPTIGGSLENANRFLGGTSIAVQSSSSREVVATHNSWGGPCVAEELLRVTGGGLVVKPWASPDLARTFDDCDDARDYAGTAADGGG